MTLMVVVMLLLLPRLLKRRYTNQNLLTGTSGNLSILGCIVRSLKKVCFVKFAKKFWKITSTLLMELGHHVVCEWNHSTELLKAHNDSKWHKDTALVARMAQQQCC